MSTIFDEHLGGFLEQPQPSAGNGGSESLGFGGFIDNFNTGLKSINDLAGNGFKVFNNISSFFEDDEIPQISSSTPVSREGSLSFAGSNNNIIGFLVIGVALALGAFALLK